MTSHGNHGSFFTIIAYARGFVNLFAGDAQLFGSFFRDPIAFLRKIRYNGNMFRIWAKIFQDERIVKQTVYERDENFSYADFFRYLSEICDALDITLAEFFSDSVREQMSCDLIVSRIRRLTEKQRSALLAFLDSMAE